MERGTKVEKKREWTILNSKYMVKRDVTVGAKYIL